MTQTQWRKRNVNLEDLTLGVGAEIRKARLLQGLTQGELAAKLNVSRTTITNIEGGNQNLGLSLLFAIAEALDYDVQINLTRRTE